MADDGRLKLDTAGKETALCSPDLVPGCFVPIVLIPIVFIDNPFELRSLLFGETRFSSGLDEDCSNVNARLFSIDLTVGVWSSFGFEGFGDSGDEDGNGSVRVESTVDTVVVGEDSVDSVVAEEPLLTCDVELAPSSLVDVITPVLL